MEQGAQYDVSMTVRNFAAPFELAGISRSDGTFERPVPDGEWQVPSRVWHEGDVLKWHVETEVLTSEERSNPWVSSRPPLLRTFLNLADATSEEIARFAARWGILGLCEPHGLPVTHPPAFASAQLISRGFAIKWDSQPTTVGADNCTVSGDLGGTESIESWRCLSAFVGALLRVAGSLHTGRFGDPGDWGVLVGDYWWDRETTPPHLLKHVLAQIIDALLQVAGVRVRFTWVVGPPEVVFTTHSLMAALAVQVSLAATQRDGFAICSGCQRFYIPSRRPSSGRRNYCQECGRPAALRDAQRDRRLRLRTGRDMDEDNNSRV